MICAGIFLISLSLLSYEIVLMRIFSITSWSHFAYMIISIALLGFGASGSFLFLFREKIKKHPAFTFSIFSFLYAVSIFFCSMISQLIPFNPFFIFWHKIQYLYLFFSYLVLFIPFFLGATCIGMGFMYREEKIPRVYFFNMVGSGTGTIFSVFLMYLFFPGKIIFFIFLSGILAFLIFSLRFRKAFFLSLFISCMIVSIFYFFPLKLRISEYKGLSKALTLPETYVFKRYFSPLGILHVVISPFIKYAPGLSLNFQKDIPAQVGIFVDADSMSAVNRFGGDFSNLGYLDFLTLSLPYHLTSQPEVLVVGAGGGSEVLNALYHGAKKVFAVEVNPQMIEIVNKDLAEFSGEIYSLPQVKTIVKEARGYVETTHKKFDIIQISLLDSFAASSAGVYALSESYLYTVEALCRFIEHLKQGGFLCITRWIKIPPRDGVRILATSVEALERLGVKDPSSHILMIRSWSTSTLLVGRSPIPPDKIKLALDFSNKRSFDVCWYPGIKKEEVNRFNILPQPYFYEAAKKIFSKDREEFYRLYLFDITPTTDDSPYFFHFFKWRSIPYLIKNFGKRWIPFVEWGYIILFATFIQVIFASVFLILFPLFFLRIKKPSVRTFTFSRVRILFYFLFIGAGYMFIEMSFVQRFILFLHHPVYAVVVVITGFLIFSGIGSLFSSHFGRSMKRFIFSFSAIIFFTIFYLFGLKGLFLQMIGYPEWMKIVFSFSLLAPFAFFMGIPFPAGLERIKRQDPSFLAWAWGVNGCASVTGSVLAVILAVSWGYTLVGILASVFYLLAFMFFCDFPHQISVIFDKRF